MYNKEIIKDILDELEINKTLIYEMRLVVAASILFYKNENDTNRAKLIRNALHSESKNIYN